VDGTNGVVAFGVLPHRLAVRSFQLDLQAGQQLNLAYGIPDLAPENTLATAKLPRVVIVAPNGRTTLLSPEIREPAHNPERNQDYLYLREYSVPAITGTYSVVVTSRAPARFFAVTGEESEEFAGIRRGSEATDAQVDEWYATAP
jgi:hypothetical protein